jgi:glutamyl-Q tRNA(Asp) synthetase
MIYRGRFAPSPTGPLHAGSLAAALASWLDARVHGDTHGGAWLIRVEDVDSSRCKPEWAQAQLQQLAAHGLMSDEPVLWQSTRSAAYTAALAQLQAQGLVYACHCSRKKISDYWQALGVDKARHGDLVYPGFCRDAALPVENGVALRLDVGKALRWHEGDMDSRFHGNDELPKTTLSLHRHSRAGGNPGVQDSPDLIWTDRHLGAQSQNIPREVGDFVLRRADACFSYQLAVVVDDAAQGISHVVRGQDLLDNTPRQILLQKALGLPTPQYLHTPLVLATDGQKLSKQNGAAALNSSSPAQCLANLQAAALALGLPAPSFQAHLPVPDYLQSLLPLWVQSDIFRVF